MEILVPFDRAHLELSNDTELINLTLHTMKLWSKKWKNSRKLGSELIFSNLNPKYPSNSLPPKPRAHSPSKWSMTIASAGCLPNSTWRMGLARSCTVDGLTLTMSRMESKLFGTRRTATGKRCWNGSRRTRRRGALDELSCFIQPLGELGYLAHFFIFSVHWMLPCWIWMCHEWMRNKQNSKSHPRQRTPVKWELHI